ncbi:MAG: hypothetical protein QOJ98_3322, partial [Acidobacteriota bacterium]|nr:hypothetical protein [Acidobacteriota bacterium]
MATINSPVTRLIDRGLGYLGLFPIGLIGWVCDRLPADRARQRPRPSANVHA